MIYGTSGISGITWYNTSGISTINSTLMYPSFTLSGSSLGRYMVTSISGNAGISGAIFYREPYDEPNFIVEYLQNYYNKFHVTYEFADFIFSNNLFGVYDYEYLVVLYKIQKEEESNTVLNTILWNNLYKFKYFKPTMDFSKVIY